MAKEEGSTDVVPHFSEWSERTKYHQAACRDVIDPDSREPGSIGDDSEIDERMWPAEQKSDDQVGARRR